MSTFNVQPDASNTHAHNSALNTLPSADYVSIYQSHKVLPPADIQKRNAFIIGGGIAGLASAFYLIRDGKMPGANITILENLAVEGGSMDGAGNEEEGYLVRGGREMNWNYDCLWDLFRDIPAIEMPEGYSVLDEYRLINDNDPNYSKSRLMHQRGKIRDFSTLGLSKSQQWELVRLLMKRKEELDDITIEQYFSKGFLESNFWYLWRSMFAFQNWQSLLEMKLYMHRFLDALDGITDLSALVFPKYNQYDSFIKPLVAWLKARGVNFRLNVQVQDVDFVFSGEQKTASALRCLDGEVIKINEKDLVFVLNGSMTEGSAYGDSDHAPVNIRNPHLPEENSAWTLWRNLAKKSPVFGRPEKFCTNTAQSSWMSATLTCKPSALIDKLKELAVNDPYSGKTVTGGVITFTDSNWVMSFTCNRQPHFPTQEKDTLVLWVYALLMDKKGNYIQKTMPECTGKEIVAELCYHLGIENELDSIMAKTKVRSAYMPYITAQFMPRAKGDRPDIIPAGCTNLAMIGQFAETHNDVVFTMESSVRTARVGVYGLLGLSKQVPDISPTQYDVRNLLKAARSLNNNEPFPGERILRRILSNSYFAHILPPAPEEKAKPSVSDELKQFLQKASEGAGEWWHKLKANKE